MSIMSTSLPTLCFDAEIVGQWVLEKAGGEWTPRRGTAIGQVKDGKLNAGVVYEDYSGTNIFCHIAGEGNWANRKFLGIIYDYPFNQLNVKRITVPVASTNEKAIKLVEQMGFTLELPLAQAIPDGDIYLFRMFKDECKYIKGKKYAVLS